MFYTDDPVADSMRYQRGQERKLNRLPKCWCCDEPIQQERAVRIGGAWYCDDCLNDFREDVEN